MCDEWMPTIRLPLSPEAFAQLPRNAAYRYEYLDGAALLTPRPSHLHGLLELRSLRPSAEACIRPFQASDWKALPPAFAGAFAAVQPFGSLDEATRLEAARQCLERTRTGGDGPWVEAASFVALDEERTAIIGAILVTLLPSGDPSAYDSYYWREPAPPDLLARREGRPHLTWIFVLPGCTREGTGSALLSATGKALQHLGYTELVTTFMLGNESSTLWHWRNGFRLLPSPGSSRRALRRLVASCAAEPLDDVRGPS